MDLFYTKETIKDWYKGYVHELIICESSFTGVAYKDEPAILAGEVGNSRAGTCCSAQDVVL